METRLFYEIPENKSKLDELITSLVKDEWTNKEIEDYFYSLGYDVFFIRRIRTILNNKH